MSGKAFRGFFPHLSSKQNITPELKAGIKKKNSAAKRRLTVCVVTIVDKRWLLKSLVCLPYRPARKKTTSHTMKRMENGATCSEIRYPLGASK